MKLTNFFKYIFSVENNYSIDEFGIKNNKTKLIYIMGIKISLKQKLTSEQEIKNELIVLKMKLEYLKQGLEYLIERQSEQSVYTKELYWSSCSNKLISQQSIPVKKCLLFKYDNFFGVGKHSGPNLGDNIQTFAVKNIIDKIYPNIKYEYIDRDNLINYNGEPAICIMQGWFSHSQSHTFFANKNIIPIYVGYHLEPTKEEDILYLLKYVPDYFNNKTIGCRDTYTKQLFQNLNIPSYLSRCLTLTLPKRTQNSNADTIYFVDVYDKYLKYIPKEFFQKYKKITQRGCDKGFDDSYYIGTSEKYYFEKAENLFKEYKENAKLVITTCLHCAAPCLAMGIPVILFAFLDDKTRYTALDGILSIYTIEDLESNNVNWYPNHIEFEDLKQAMISNLELTIKEQLGEKINSEELKQLQQKIENYKIIN